MKKANLKALSLIFFSFLFSCDHSDPPYFGYFNLYEYLVKTGFNENGSETVNGVDAEFGIRFKPKVNGYITTILVDLPDDRTNLRVTIWDTDTKTALLTETFASVSKNMHPEKSITPFALTKNKEYMITMNSNDNHAYFQVDGGDAIYPVSIGPVSITGYGASFGTSQTYPTIFETNIYRGDLSFVFIDEHFFHLN